MASINLAVLSHHHYDHGGGLRRFLELNSDAKIYLGEPPDGDCFIKAAGLVKKYIGLDKTLFTEYPDRFIIVRKPLEILPDVFLLPRILDVHPRPAGNKKLFLKKGQDFVLDDFAHEIILVIREAGKLVIFTGCSHNGVLNMVDTVADAFTNTPIKAVIGGFHLMSPPFNSIAGTKNEVRNIAQAMLDYPVEMTYTGHCTGEKAFAILQEVMGERLQDIQTGSCFDI